MYVYVCMCMYMCVHVCFTDSRRLVHRSLVRLSYLPTSIASRLRKADCFKSISYRETQGDVHSNIVCIYMHIHVYMYKYTEY